jgi:hypothetical protein
MQAYELNHEIYSAVMSFVRATRYDERLQVEKLAQRERKNIITQIAKNVAELHDVDADELIKVAAHQMA